MFENPVMVGCYVVGDEIEDQPQSSLAEAFA
jgi:hypothetical protein